MAAAMVTATDTIVSAQVHTMDQVMDIKKEQGIVREGRGKGSISGKGSYSCTVRTAIGEITVCGHDPQPCSPYEEQGNL